MTKDPFFSSKLLCFLSSLLFNFSTFPLFDVRASIQNLHKIPFRGTLRNVKKVLSAGGALLMGSAVMSKLLGLLRDRLLVSHFPGEELDWVFAAFRIPDFFFFLLVGGTVSTLFLPRAVELDHLERKKFFSSFLWLVVVVFGLFCLAGALWPEFFVQMFATGFSAAERIEIADLVRWLFGSVFLLSVSSVFSASQQARQKFLSVALAPVLYTGGICAGIFFWAGSFGMEAVGWAAVAGASVHLLVNVVAHFLGKQSLTFAWKKPRRAWQKFTSDFSFRTANNAAFQINLSADIWIGSFLIAGSIGAFQLGMNLAFASFTVVGIPLASAAFPRLTQAKRDPAEQKKIVRDTLRWIAILSVPAALALAIGANFWLRFLFGVDGELLRMGTPLLQIMALSVPFACAIPLLSRVYMANDDVRTPMKFSAISIGLATATAAVLSLVILPDETAVLGLAIGTVVANLLSAILFGTGVWRRFQRQKND